MPKSPDESEAEYIRRILRAHPRELGFIPIDPDHPPENIRWIHERGGEIVGFMIHGPPRTGGYTRIYELVVEAPWRRIKHGTDTFEQLRDLAKAHQTPWITLRCADDLEANQFWRYVGAQPLARRPGGRTTGRTLIEYAALTHRELLELAPLPPQPPRKLIRTSTPLAVVPSEFKIASPNDIKLTIHTAPTNDPAPQLAMTHRQATGLAIALTVAHRKPKK